MSLNARPVAQPSISHANTDISDHKVGESKTPECGQRREQESRIPEMLLSSMVDYAYALDREGRFLYVNQPLLNLWGLKLEDTVGKNFFDLQYPRELAARLQEQIQKVFATGQRITDETQYTSPSGVVGFYEYILSPIFGSEGRLELVAGATRNISARKDEERHLVHMEARYRGLLEAAPDAMVVIDKFGKIVLLNAQTEKQFGYSRDVLIGQEVTNIIPKGFAERLIADGTRTAAEALAQQIGTGIELIGKRKDGSEFPIEIMLSPLESDGEILVTAAIRDITLRKETEANLVQKIEELNRSNEELEQFAYVASHDLQEPLRMVASYTQLLAKRYKGRLDSEADEFIAFAVDGASRMQRLIQDLLVYSRVGKRRLELIKVSSEEALRMALGNLRAAIFDSGALVTHDFLPEIEVDESQLVQLFQNLVGNGIKYQNPGIPRIHISAAREGETKWKFSIQDNGLGIDPKFFERIFGMFQRLHKRDEFAGTGMGLTICKRIVERHGGSISVESQPGQGSTFYFTLAESRKRV